MLSALQYSRLQAAMDDTTAPQEADVAEMPVNEFAVERQVSDIEEAHLAAEAHVEHMAEAAG